MPAAPLAKRFSRLPRATVLDRELPIASTRLTRLLGLAYLDREDAGAGLLIPRCASVHTFGMRFPLDIYFLDDRGTILDVRRDIPARRVLFCRTAKSVFEAPARESR